MNLTKVCTRRFLSESSGGKVLLTVIGTRGCSRYVGLEEDIEKCLETILRGIITEFERDDFKAFRYYILTTPANKQKRQLP